MHVLNETVSRCQVCETSRCKIDVKEAPPNIMRSTAPRNSPERSRTGKVFVEKPDILDDIIESIDQQGLGTGSRFSEARSVSLHSKTSVATSDHVKLLKEQQRQRTAQTEAVMKQNIQKSLERQNEKQERLFPVLLSNLDKATNFLEIIEKDINLHDETQKNKVRRQFEDWNSAVHGSIQVINKFVHRLYYTRTIFPVTCSFSPFIEKNSEFGQQLRC